ncbi:MAG TPA: hypothetical protein VK807_16490 [Gemmatimonadaceae bacterium]|nr:hypothetical protein [Gemmatimonadaceae bacterium]
MPCSIVTVAYHTLRERAIVWSAVVGLFVACGAVGYLLAAWVWDECEAHYEAGAAEPST